LEALQNMNRKVLVITVLISVFCVYLSIMYDTLVSADKILIITEVKKKSGQKFHCFFFSVLC